MCLISRLGMRGISCKHFSLQRAPHAGVLEAAALFFDAHEESLGPARDAPLSGDFRLHSAILCTEPALAESEHLFVREDDLAPLRVICYCGMWSCMVVVCGGCCGV